MRRWRDQAAPDDPEAYYAVGRMWPTKRGTYETADFSTGTSKSATSAGTVLYAFCARTLTGAREYVVDSARLWEYSSGSLTDRTNGVTVGSIRNIHMTQYGNDTYCVMGTANPTVVSSGGNFAAAGGSVPQARIIGKLGGALMVANTSVSADEFAFSDQYNPTDFLTGEAERRRILDTEGPINAAVQYGDAMYFFKKSAIYRASYIGGNEKYRVELVWLGLGVGDNTYSGGQYQAVATGRGIVFNANQAGNGNNVYLFDGVSPPRCLNPDTTLDSSFGVYLYNPIDEVLTIAPALGSNASGTEDAGDAASLYYYYSFQSEAWGSGIGSAEEDYEATTTFPQVFPNGVLQGDYYARAETSSKPVYWRFRNITTGAFYRCAPSAPSATSTCFLQTSKVGTPERRTLFTRLTTIMRRMTDLGTDSATCELTLFTEREDASARITRSSIAESSYRKRFDLSGGEASDFFARFKVTWTARDVEVDDLVPTPNPSGTE